MGNIDWYDRDPLVTKMLDMRDASEWGTFTLEDVKEFQTWLDEYIANLEKQEEN